MMILGVIQQKHDRTCGVYGTHQVFKKEQEGGRILLFRFKPNDRLGHQVERCKQVKVLLLASGGHGALLTTLHPTAPQQWLQTQGRFVHSESLDLAGLGFF